MERIDFEALAKEAMLKDYKEAWSDLVPEWRYVWCVEGKKAHWSTMLGEFFRRFRSNKLQFAFFMDSHRSEIYQQYSTDYLSEITDMSKEDIEACRASKNSTWNEHSLFRRMYNYFTRKTLEEEFLPWCREQYINQARDQVRKLEYKVQEITNQIASFEENIENIEKQIANLEKKSDC